MTVRDPIVRNGSILGDTDAGVAAAALADVRLLEVRRLSIGRTMAIFGALVALPFVIVGIQCSGDAFC